ncbi:MAG: acetate uptake transporter [Nocardioidaceae bacterium]
MTTRSEVPQEQVAATTPPLGADPAALGLAGFALTTFILSAHNAGWAPDLIWVGCAFFYGGMAQFLAGMWEFKNQNTFGAVAFSSYGAFWFSLAFFFVLDLTGKIPASDLEADLGWFLLSFAIFNTYLMIWSTRVNLAVFGVLVVLEITEILLFVGFLFKLPLIVQIGGYAGVADAVVAWYTASALLANSMARRSVVPVGGPLWRD